MPKPLKQPLRHFDMGGVDSRSNPPFVCDNSSPRSLPWAQRIARLAAVRDLRFAKIAHGRLRAKPLKGNNHVQPYSYWCRKKNNKYFTWCFKAIYSSVHSLMAYYCRFICSAINLDISTLLISFWHFQFHNALRCHKVCFEFNIDTIGFAKRNMHRCLNLCFFRRYVINRMVVERGHFSLRIINCIVYNCSFDSIRRLCS